MDISKEKHKFDKKHKHKEKHKHGHSHKESSKSEAWNKHTAASEDSSSVTKHVPSQLKEFKNTKTSDMEVDELLEDILDEKKRISKSMSKSLNDDNESISSMSESDEENEKNEKKRKRSDSQDEQGAESDQDDEMDDSVLIMGKVAIKSAVLDFGEIANPDLDLWLFKVPEGLNPKDLHGKLISSGSHIQTKNSRFELFEGNQNESDAFLNVWPSMEHERLKLGKPFKRFIRISEASAIEQAEPQQALQNFQHLLQFGVVPNPFSSMSESPIHHTSEFVEPVLKVRYSLPGSERISSLKSKKEKHKEKHKKHKSKESS